MRAFYNYLSTIYLKSYGSNYDRMLSGVAWHPGTPQSAI